MEKDKKKEEKKKGVIQFFPRNKIIQEYKYGSIVLREYESICCDGAALIEGFNKGLTSVMVTNYIVEKLKLPIVADIISNKFQTYCRVEDGKPLPGCRVYGNKRLVVFISEYEFKDPSIQNELVTAIYDFSKRHRNKVIIAVDGIPGDPTKDKKDIVIETDKKKKHEPSKSEILREFDKGYEQKIWYLTNNEEISTKMEKLDHHPVKSMAVRGITGGILAEAPFTSVSVLGIFGNLDPLLKIGTHTAVSIIQCIDKILDKVKIDVSDLTKTDENIKKKIKEVVKTIKTPVGKGVPPQGWGARNMYM